MSKIGYIYSIVSKTEGTVYIGSTTKKKVEYRWNEHKRDLLNHSHCDYKLIMIYSHYGIEDLIFTCEQVIEFEDYQELIDIEGIEIRHIPEDWSLNIERYPEKGPMYGRTGKLSPLYGIPKSESHKINMSKNHAHISGRDHPTWGKILIDKKYFLHFPNGKHYFVRSMKMFCNSQWEDKEGILRVIGGKQKSYKGITGERAPKWLVDKIEPKLRENQYWIEVKIINRNKNDDNKNSTG